MINISKGLLSEPIPSLGYIDHGYKWVVFADISGCFENISLKRLSLDLRNLGVTENIVKSLSCCLNRWAEPKERGIPQGNRCSFILGEIYFDYIDKRLKYGDYTFCRYVDDFRIFCKSKGEAVKALHFLTQLVREKELNLQTAKSYILESQEAKKKLDKIAVIIREVEENLLIELSDIAQYDFGYSTPASIEIKIQMTEEDEVDLITIQRAFEKYIVADNSKFDKTFFHYCINRLGASKDSHAVDFCLEMVLERPEEFIHMLHYFSKLKERRLEIAEKLINIFKDADCLLERHYYLLLRWVYIEKLQSELILELCRKKGLNSCSDQYTKHYAWAIFGENGDAADLDAIEAQYNDIQNELSRAIIISSIRKMIKERRNSIYNRAKDDGILVQYAINRFK
jgi:hypothetical protein